VEKPAGTGLTIAQERGKVKSMKGIIYKATNTVNGKVYIGKTERTLSQRKSEHKYMAKVNDRRSPFQIAILKYGGVSAFIWEQIDTFANAEELEEKEKFWVAFYKADNPAHGYNHTVGGIKTVYTQEARKKISEAQKGEKSYWFGKSHTFEARKKMSEAHKGINTWQKGKKASEETKRKMSEARKGKNSTLTETRVKQIKIALANGEKGISLARKYCVTESVISQIKHGKTWAWV
jgi:group I intron endonuclease